MAKKKSRAKTYKVVPFNIHVKGPVLNKGYMQLYSNIEKQLKEGELIVPPNPKGVVIRCMSAVDFKDQNATKVSLLKFNSNATGLAWDLSKEELIQNTSLVSAQLVDGIFFHSKHIFVLLPKPHGPSDSEVEDYLKKVFKEASDSTEASYMIDVNVFKQSGSFQRIESWDVIRSMKVEVYRNNPINNEVGNRLSELADILTSDKVEITARANVRTGISRDGAHPILEGADRLAQKGQARLTAEGIVDGHKDYVDTQESKAIRMSVKSYPDDEGGLIGEIKRSILKLLF